MKSQQFLVKKSYWIHFYWWTKNNNKRQYNTTTIKSTAEKSNGFVMGLCVSTNWNNNEVLVKTNLIWLHFYWWAKKTIPKDNTTTIKSTAKKSNFHEIGLNTSMYSNNKEVLVKLKIPDYKSNWLHFYSWEKNNIKRQDLMD